MRKIHETWQFLRLAALKVIFSKKQKKTVFREDLWEYVYQISGLYRFFVWPGGIIQIHK